MTKRLTKGRLVSGDREELPAREFAFPAQRKEPLEDAAHVRNAIARFDQVKRVSGSSGNEHGRAEPGLVLDRLQSGIGFLQREHCYFR